MSSPKNFPPPLHLAASHYTPGSLAALPCRVSPPPRSQSLNRSCHSLPHQTSHAQAPPAVLHPSFLIPSPLPVRPSYLPLPCPGVDLSGLPAAFESSCTCLLHLLPVRYEISTKYLADTEHVPRSYFPPACSVLLPTTDQKPNHTPSSLCLATGLRSPFPNLYPSSLFSLSPSFLFPSSPPSFTPTSLPLLFLPLLFSLSPQ